MYTVIHNSVLKLIIVKLMIVHVQCKVAHIKLWEYLSTSKICRSPYIVTLIPIILTHRQLAIYST